MSYSLNKISAALVILAVCIRLGLYVALPGVFAFERTGSVQGFVDYDLIAQNLIASNEFTPQSGTLYAGVAPAYPYTLAAMYALFGRGSLPVVLLNCAFGALAIACLLRIARRIMPRGEAVGLIAAILFAAYPYFVFQDLTVIDTAMFTGLLLAFLYVAILLAARPGLNRGTWALIVLGGLLLGLLTLTRPLGITVGIAVFFWFWIKRGLLTSIVRLLPVALVSVLVLVPWNIRNIQVFGKFINIGTHAGMNFWFGNSEYTIPFFRAGYHTQWATPQPPPQPLKPPEMDGYLLNLGLKFLREHPEKIPELLWVKFAAYWDINIFPSKNPVSGEVALDPSGNLTIAGVPASDPLVAYSEPLFDKIGRLVHIFYFGGLLVLGLVGAILTRQHWRDVSLIWCVQAVMTVMYVMFSGPTTRYRVPTDPLLFLFSAYTLVLVVRWAQHVRRVPFVEAHQA